MADDRVVENDLINGIVYSLKRALDEKDWPFHLSASTHFKGERIVIRCSVERDD